jgi:hypothetical protein
MSATSSKNVQVCMSTDTAATTLSPTAITAAKPAALTVTASTLVTGDLVFVDKTGIAALDGKWWVVGAASTATSVVLLGSDNTGGATAVAPGAIVNTRSGTGSMECLCLSNFAIQRDTPGTISVATFCDPSASVPSVVTQAGTVTIGGYVDTNAADFKAVVAADLDGKKHQFRVTLPGNGYIVFEGVISGFSYDIPLDGALAWSATITLSGVPRHLF